MSTPLDTYLRPIPATLQSALLTAYSEIQRNYRERRWEPAELNGGKMCEVVYTILKGHADGSYPATVQKPRNLLQACQELERHPNSTLSRSFRIQIPRLLIALYEMRNNRNVGHIGGDIDPNHMDATLVLHISRWLMAELIRHFHSVDLETASKVVDDLCDRILPLVWEINGKRRVLRDDLTAEQESLIVLYSASHRRMPVDELLDSVEYKNATRFRNELLGRLHKKRFVEFDKDRDSVVLSPTGIAFVEKTILT